MKHANISVFIPHLACRHACVFCNQNNITGSESVPTPDEVGRYLAESVSGLRNRKAEIAFFGGSFTGLDKESMSAYLKAAAPYVDGKKVTGIRLSTRPDYIDTERLDILKKYGVTTVELGVQSMDDGVLKSSGRGHTAEDVVGAAGMIKDCGFELVLQLMPGLPGDTVDKAEQSVKKAAGLEPDAMRIYPTVVVKDTPLETMFKRGTYRPFSLSEAVEVCIFAKKLLGEKGIDLIRMGLHSDISEEKIVAGPYHPAFGELVYNELYCRLICEKMPEHRAAVRQKLKILCAPGEISKVAGQNKKNINFLKEEYNIERVTIKESERLIRPDILIEIE